MIARFASDEVFSYLSVPGLHRRPAMQDKGRSGWFAGLYHLVPEVEIRAESEGEIRAILSACHEMRIPPTFRGRGTSVSG